MNNLVKIITLVVVIAMVAAMALVSCGKEEPVDNTTNEQIEALNATIESLKAALDKAQADATAENAELEAALKDAIASLEQAGINSEKWTEATANIPTALKAIADAKVAILVDYGYAIDEKGNFVKGTAADVEYADIWYVAADLKAAADAAEAVALDAINRAVIVDEQNAAIEAFKAALAPENFEKIDVKIKGIIAAIEADGVTYPADKKLVEEDLVAAIAAVANCCEDARKAVADAKYEEKAAKLTEAFNKDAVKVLAVDYKAAMDAFSAKETTVALIDEANGVKEILDTWTVYCTKAGTTVSKETSKKLQNSINKYNEKLVEVAVLDAFVKEVTSVKDEEKNTVDGFNALMAATLKEFDTCKNTGLKGLKDKIDYYKKDIENLVEGKAEFNYFHELVVKVNDVAVENVSDILADLLEIEENYNIINHETVEKLDAAFAEKTDAIVAKGEAFIAAVEALEELEKVDATIGTLIANAKAAYDALEADYKVADDLDLFLAENDDEEMVDVLADAMTTYETSKALFHGIQDLVNVINTNIESANKLVYVNYQYDKKESDNKTLKDANYYTITKVDYATFKKVFLDEYQDVDGVLAECIKNITAAEEKLTKPTKAQVEAGAEGDGTGLYGLKIADDVAAKIEAIKLTKAKVDAIAEVLEFFDVTKEKDVFDGKTALRAEIVNDIWAATTADSVDTQKKSIADEFEAAKKAVTEASAVTPVTEE